MISEPRIKLLARNVAAFRRGGSVDRQVRLVPGNPVSTRLESGVGNCFPGLECDLRNLERRFFPLLEVDIGDNEIRVVSVDLAGLAATAAAGGLPPAAVAAYQRIATDTEQGRNWSISRLSGDFGPLGALTLEVRDFTSVSSGPGRRPADAWTAIRLLREGTNVTIRLTRPSQPPVTLVGARTRYLDDNGALATIFLPGELNQSLCSPWTHDFRDCACFYWASNHPDIALPPLPTPAPNQPEWNAPVEWERADRSSLGRPPAAVADGPGATGPELDHLEINSKWQLLNFVVEGRERLTPYAPASPEAHPLASAAELERHLRYAAGVELAVVQQYLAAAYSIRSLRQSDNEAFTKDISAAKAELMRIAIEEMRHLRSVNDVLASLAEPRAFLPALNVASLLPATSPGGAPLPVRARPATHDAILEFVAIEQPSASVDGLYARILATLVANDSNQQAHTIRSVMAEGEEHWRTFRFIFTWLNRHPEADYLRSTNLQVPPPGNPQHAELQARYKAVLEQLYAGYSAGIPSGAGEINAARMAMLGVSGLQGSAEAVAAAGFLVAFDAIADPRFQALDPP